MPSPEAQQIYKLLDPSTEVSTENLSALKKLLSEQPQVIKETCLIQINRYDTRSTVNMSPLLYVMRENPNIDLINLLCEFGADASEYESYLDPKFNPTLHYRDPRQTGCDYFVERHVAKTHIKLQNTLPHSATPVTYEFLSLLTTTRYSPLHYAILSDDTELFFLLWKRHKQAYLQKIQQSKGASVSLLSVDTAAELTQLAILMGRVDIAKVFIERGQFVKSDKIDVLVKAAIAHDQVDILKFLTGDDTEFKIDGQTIGEVAVAITGNQFQSQIHIPYSQSKCLQHLISSKFKKDGYYPTYEWLGNINFELSKALGAMCEVNQRLQNAVAEKSVSKVKQFFEQYTFDRAIHLVVSNNSLDDLKFLETCGAPLTTNIALTCALAGHSDDMLLYCLNKNHDFECGKISSEHILHDAIIRDSSQFIQAIIDNPKISRKQLKELAKLAVELNAINVFKILCRSGLVQDIQGELTNIALKKKHEEVLEELLCQVEHSDQYFYNLLLSAIEHKDLELVESLIPRVPINVIHDQRLTPLQTAVLHYDQAIFNLVLAQTTDVNAFSRSNSPLILAIGLTPDINKDVLHIVEALLMKGAKPNQMERLSKENRAKIPFCSKKFTTLQENKLHSKGSTFNKKAPSTNAFLLATATFPTIRFTILDRVYKADTAIFNLMLAHGADLTLVDGIGNNPLITLLANMNYQFEDEGTLQPCLNLLPFLLRQDKSLLFKENNFSVSALSLGKSLGEKYFKSILTTSFSLLIEHHLKEEEYSAAEEAYHIMSSIQKQMEWDDLCAEVTSFSFCIISKHVQFIPTIADYVVDLSSLVIKKTLTSVKDTFAEFDQMAPKNLKKMWANRKIQKPGSFQLDGCFKISKNSGTRPLSPLIWALKHDQKDLFSKLVTLNPESLKHSIPSASKTHMQRKCSTEGIETDNNINILQYLKVLIQSSHNRDFSHYITVMLQHYKDFNPLEWQALLTGMLAYQYINQHLKTHILDCIQKLGDYISYDTGIPSCADQSVTIFAGAFGDTDILGAIEQAHELETLNLNYESPRLQANALTSAVDHCNLESVRWLICRLHIQGSLNLFSRYFNQTYLDAAYDKVEALCLHSKSEPDPNLGSCIMIFNDFLKIHLTWKSVPKANVFEDPEIRVACRSLVKDPRLASMFDKFIEEKQKSATANVKVEETRSNVAP
jgi:hypothetical protein